MELNRKLAGRGDSGAWTNFAILGPSLQPLFCFEELTFVVLTRPPESHSEDLVLTDNDIKALPVLKRGF